MRRVRRGLRVIEADESLLVETDKALVEGLHPVVARLFDDVSDLVRLLRIEDAVPYTPVTHHQLDRRCAATPNPGKQSLRNDADQGTGQTDPYLCLLMWGEEIHNAVHGFDNVGRVHRSDDE